MVLLKIQENTPFPTLSGFRSSTVFSIKSISFIILFLEKSFFYLKLVIFVNLKQTNYEKKIIL